ncbi:MAG TPA: DUF4129 domain-containing protein [Nocardioides sp.]|uniref:DUF4129 domain-containing protein n=1 Tax=Nocardioides sp. TaxID=35761 RepID=UPI002E372926|nr:DUF4129 domain-containing protein [Nocardioides sp.]HEX5087156.1 DUF4129 domain-containing protein [Nocardioides sp.]
MSVRPERGTSPARASTSAVAAVLCAVGLLLVLVTWAASIGPDRVVSGGHVEPVNPLPTATTSAPPPPNPLQEARRHLGNEQPGWVGPVAFGLEVLTAAVVLFLAVRLLHRLQQAWMARRWRRRREVEGEVEFEVLGSAAQVTEVIAEDADDQRSLLEVGGEPRNAIVECWHRFEQQAQRAGVERRPWQTTSEFVLGLLDLVGADQGAVAQLAELYREARFSDHPMTDAHRRRALESLDAIHRSLRSRALR